MNKSKITENIAVQIDEAMIENQKWSNAMVSFNIFHISVYT